MMFYTNAIMGLTAVSSSLFGFTESMSNYLQGANLPIEFIQMLPYLAIVVIYVVYCANKSKKEIMEVLGLRFDFQVDKLINN